MNINQKYDKESLLEIAKQIVKEYGKFSSSIVQKYSEIHGTPCFGTFRKYWDINDLKNELCLKMINKPMNFVDWCNKYNRDDLLERYDEDKNGCPPEEFMFVGTNNKKIWLKCTRNIHESDQYKIMIIHNHPSLKWTCRKCKSFAQVGIDLYGNDFLEKYWDYQKNDIDPYVLSAKSDKKIWIKCTTTNYHGSFQVVAHDIFKMNMQCPYCNNRKRIHPKDSIAAKYPQIKSIWSDKNIKTPEEYSEHSSKQVWWKCENNIHDDYCRKISESTEAEFRCPECVHLRTESLIEEKVRNFISSLGYSTLHEQCCNLIPINPKTNRKLRYDNEIQELKLIIEVHGIQHYQTVDFKYMKDGHDETRLMDRQWRDEYKKEYALNNGYSYLSIPYWDIDNGNYKHIILNTINTIKNKEDSNHAICS